MGSTGALGIVGVWASFPKKLDPEDLLATLILLATPELPLSVEVAGRAAGFADVVVVGGGAKLGARAIVVVAGAVAVTGLSAFNLEISQIIGLHYGFVPPSFSRAAIS